MLALYTALARELTRLHDAILSAAQRLEDANLVFGHGTSCARDEAVWLVLAALGLNPTEQLAEKELAEVLSDKQRQSIAALIERRINERQPAAYLIGEAWFCGRPYIVNQDVLVPRSPLAELIQCQFQPWVEMQSVHRVLELCTGSGCIGIATALAMPHLQVDITDISAAALQVATLNQQRYQAELGERLQIFQGDLFAALPSNRRNAYPLIISNPPYVDAEDMAALAAEFQHEPVLGLAAGGDGLDIALRMLAEAPDWLTGDGLLICEVGNSAAALDAALPELPLNWLEFEQGGAGVFAVYADELLAYQDDIYRLLRARDLHEG